MEIKVRVKIVFGQKRIYPACPVSETIARIKGDKTLSKYDIDQLKGIGYTVTVLPEEL